MGRALTILLICGILVVELSPSRAQAAAGAQNKVNEGADRGPKKQLQTIVFSGLAGSVLGLSTLSFYGRPQDKLNNIAIGAAVGIIVGTIYTTYKAATEPRDFYNLYEPEGERGLLAFAPQPVRGAEHEPLTPVLRWRLSF